MRPRVYFVDEDVSQTWPLRAELELRGMDVVPFETADDAFEVLVRCEDASVIIIDVMLAVGSYDHERFSRSRTDMYLETGLAFLEDLVEQRSDLGPRCILLTNTSKPRTLDKASRLCEKLGARLWRKPSFSSPMDFGEQVQGVVDGSLQ